MSQDRALLGYFGLGSSLPLAQVTAPPAELQLLGKGGMKRTLLLEDPWELGEDSEVGSTL